MGAIPQFVDNTYGTLGSGITASDTSISLTAGHGVRFPAVASGQVLHATLVNSSNVLEQIHITAHTANSDSLTVTRGENGTTAKAWSASDRIECRPTSEFLNDLAEIAVSAKYWAVGDGATDDTAAFVAAADAVDALGGGTVYVPRGTYATTSGIAFGDGSNSTVSTKHNKVVFTGAGMGSSTGVINQQVNGATKIKYTGLADPSAAVISFAGPMYGVGLENIEVDCNSLAGIGVLVNHVTQATFSKVSARNYTSIGWSLTTRTGFPTGCAFGCGDNVFDQCYGWVDDASLAAATIIGVKLNSGVSTAVSLVGQPDSARNIFRGGTFMYGTTATSYGFYLSGADNNKFDNVFPFPYGGSTSGKDYYFNQWAASGNFPLENAFVNCAAANGIDGNGSVGSGWGNTFSPLPTSDAGGTVSLPTGVSGVDHTGKTYVAGVRAYRLRQSTSAVLNNSVQSNATTGAVNVPGLSVLLTTLAASKLRISFSGRAAKSTAGLGFFILAINGSAQGETRTDVNADGVWHPVSAEGLYAAGAGVQTVTVQFTSSDANAVQISHGSLVVEGLY